MVTVPLWTTSELPLDEAGLSTPYRHQVAAQWEDDIGDMRTVGQQVHRTAAGGQGRVGVQAHPPLLLPC